MPHKKGSMPIVTFENKTYSLTSRKTQIPNLTAMKRLDALLWLHRHTRARGYSRPNPLAGLGDVIKIESR